MKKNKIFIGLLLLLIFVVVFLKVIKGFIPLPIWARHIINMAIEPQDLYQPIVTDKFLFYRKGFSKTYSLEPKYLDSYAIGFYSEDNSIYSQYKFNGKIKADFFYKDRLLFTKTTTSINAAWYVENDMKYYKKVSLMDFDIPLKGKYKDNISVVLTVLETDRELEKFGDSIKLYIAVSPTP